MARSEARLFNEIWDDADFIALPELTQRAYFLLLSQRDLAHSGILPLRETRWARKGPTETRDDWRQHLELLAERRYVIVDWDTEEVLIRSLMRRDRIFKEPNIVKSAVKSAAATESRAILAELAIEIARIREENPDLTKGQDDALAEMEKVLVERVPTESPAPAVRSIENPSPKSSIKGSSSPSAETTAKDLGGKGVVTTVTTDSPFPDSPLVPPPAGDASPVAAKASQQLALVDPPAVEVEPRTAQEIVKWWIDHCHQRPAGQVVGQVAKHIKGLLDENFTPSQICQGIGEWAGRDQHPSSLPSFVSNVANRRAPIRAAPPAAQRPFTTDERVAGWLALEPPPGYQEAR